MCVPGVYQALAKQVSRRSFLRAAAAGTALSAAGCSAAKAAPSKPAQQARSTTTSFSRVVDLTHSFTPDFPTYSGKEQFELKQLTSASKDGYTSYQWTLSEHTATHLDAPAHFADGQLTADELAVEKLVLPLAVIDIRAKVERSADAQLTVADIKAWEAEHGRLPEGCCVAMNSGWDKFVKDQKFRNADSNGVLHFPGFHGETAQFLLEERATEGIAVDTLSLDYGQSKDFAAHLAWLPQSRWGLECVANLSALPPRGATIVVGAPTVVGASGGPSRVIALV